MIEAKLTKNIIKVENRETLTRGQVNTVAVHFSFSHEWDNLLRIAVFKAGNITRNVTLDETNTCFVPPEVTTHVGESVHVGVHGTKSDGVVVLPSTNACLGIVREGANPGNNCDARTPDLWEQLAGKIARLIEGTYTKEEMNNMLGKELALFGVSVGEQISAFKNDVYLKSQIEAGFAKKEHTHPTASCKDVTQERVSLVGITTITQQGADAYPFIHENYLDVTGTDEATFFVECKGNTDIEIKATGMMWNHPIDSGSAHIYIDGKPLEGESISENEAKYTYNGNINDGITLRGIYMTFDFIKCSGIARVYTDGFMTGQQAEKLASLETQIGDIESALDELHNYATSLIGGEA